MSRAEMCGVFIPEMVVAGSGRANSKGRDRTGRVDAQQVVEGGGGINECCAGGITVLYWWLSLFLEFMN